MTSERSNLFVPPRVHAGLALTVLALCGCGGNYSVDDLEYIAAVPKKAALSSNLSTSASGGWRRIDPGANALGQTSGLAAFTLGATTTFNGGLGFLLDIVERVVDTYPPSHRAPNARVWGPWAADRFPGWTHTLTIARDPQAPDHFVYQITIDNPHGVSVVLLQGEYFASAGTIRHGAGNVALLVDQARSTLEANGVSTAEFDAAFPPTMGNLTAGYDNHADPIMVTMTFSGPSGPTPDGAYQFRLFSTGEGQMRFVSIDRPSGNVFGVESHWRSDHAGYATAGIESGPNAGAHEVDCWDAQLQIEYENQSWPGGTVIDNPGPGACLTLQPFLN